MAPLPRSRSTRKPASVEPTATSTFIVKVYRASAQAHRRRSFLLDGRRRTALPRAETRGVEHVEQRMHVVEHRFRDQIAACEAEHVAVTGVAARDPHAVGAGHAAGERQVVAHDAEDAGPAVLDLDGSSDEV